SSDVCSSDLEMLWFKVPSSVDGVTAARPAVSRGAGENALLLARWLASDGADAPPVGNADELQRVGAALDNAHRYFDGPVVDFFRQQLVRCKADDGTLGPAAALPLVL